MGTENYTCIWTSKENKSSHDKKVHSWKDWIILCCNSRTIVVVSKMKYKIIRAIVYQNWTSVIGNVQGISYASFQGLFWKKPFVCSVIMMISLGKIS